MTLAPKPIPRAFAFMESRQLGVAWVLAVVLGAIVISSNASITRERFIVPVAIMIAYGLFVFNRWSSLFATASQAYKLSIVAQLADSMYFMGFVWTLWALIDSFVIHQISTGDAIFRSFGYALVTTAMGMFSRLAILQFKYTATEQSQGAQDSVEELLLKFATTLQSTLNVLEQWHTTLAAATAAIGSANTGFIASVEHARTELTASMTTATGDYLSMLAATQTQLERVAKETGMSLKTSLQDGISGGLRDFGQQTAANLDQIREATTGLAATLKRTNTGLGKSVADLTLKVSETTQQVETATGTITTATQGVSTAFNEMTSRLTATMNKTSESLTTATHAISQSMGGLAEDIKREIQLGLDGITVTPHVAVTVDEGLLNQAVTPVRDGLQRISSQASGIQDTLNTRLSTGPSADDILQRVDAVLQTAVATLSGRLEKLQTEVQSLRPGWGRWFGR
jgi:hypothetical protein